MEEGKRRRSIRLPDYDYTSGGVYFVTVCTYRRACVLGSVVEAEVSLSRFGALVREEWFRTATLRPYVELEEAAFVVMPNHVHGIIWIDDDAVGARRRRAPAPERFGSPVRGSLATIVRAFKAVTTRRINELRGTPGEPFWQRNYYEHVIRDDRSLRQIRQYIADNPLRWATDSENPDAV